MNRDMKTQLLWAFYLPSLLMATAWGLLTPVLPVFASELTNSYVLIGILLAGYSIGQMLMAVPAGILLRHFTTRQTMLIGLGVSLLGIILLLPVHEVWLATVLLLLSGAGLSIYGVSRHAYIAAVTQPKVRGRTIGLLGGVYRMGKFLGPVMGGWAAATFGLRAAFVVFILLYVVTVFFVWRFMSNISANEQSDTPYERFPMRDTVQQNMGVFATAGVGQVLAQLTRMGWQWAIPLYAAEALNLSVDTIGLVVGIGAALDAALFYSAGILMDRFGRKWAIVPSFFVQGIGVLLIPFTSSAWMLAAAAGLIGAANATSSGTMMTLGGDFAPPQSRGEFLGVWRLIGDVGMVGAPLIVGGVAQALALPVAIWTIAGVGFGTSLWFALLVPETLKQVQATFVAGD